MRRSFKLFVILAIGVAVFTHSGLSQPNFSIVAQPEDVRAVHGGNVSFSVGVTVTDVSYHWLKNGNSLVDRGNVSGTEGCVLNLIGAAQNDVGDYSVIVSNRSGAVTSGVARLTVDAALIFSDSFENGLDNWSVYFQEINPKHPQATTLNWSNLKNHTEFGTKSALLSRSTDKMFHNLGVELTGRVRMAFWMYDDGGNQTRCYGEVRGYNGPGHAAYHPPGGVKQGFSIGIYQVPFGTNHSGTIAEEAPNASRYQAKVERGRNKGWFNLSGPERSIGWHKFEIERAANGRTVQFYVDGVLGGSIDKVYDVPLDCILIGSVAQGNTVGNAWFDDIEIQAYPGKFNWQNLDSSGGGIFDWMKNREIGTNVSVGPLSAVAEILGKATNDSQGIWQVEGNGILSKSVRGSLEYSVNHVPSRDVYRIEVEGSSRGYRMRPIEAPIVVSMDGEYLGRFKLRYDRGTNGSIRCFTPFIDLGRHTIRLTWDNTDDHNSLHIEAVRLQSIHGRDSDEDGVKDWVENRLRAQNGIESDINTTFVSPACIEGRGQYLSMTEIYASNSGSRQRMDIRNGPGNRWYSNIPLSAGEVTTVEVLYQNGGLSETKQLIWRESNIFTCDEMTIRKGDALLLTALPPGKINGTMTISIQFGEEYTTDSNTPIIHRFNVPGSYIVKGTFHPDNVSRSFIVKVLDDPPTQHLAAWAGHKRIWDYTGMAPELTVNLDARLQSQPLGVSRMQIFTEEAEPRYAVWRIGKNGPIVGDVAIDGFRLFNCQETWLDVIQNFPDGSQLIEAGFIMSPVNKNVQIKLKIIVSGVTFQDGTLVKTITGNDFDSLGICRVNFIRSAGVKTSVCHTTKVFEGDTLIGWPVYDVKD